MSGTETHYWPRAALAGDTIRGSIATLLSAAIGLASDPFSMVFFVALGLAVLFGLYLFQTISRMTSTVRVDDKGIQLHNGITGARELAWSSLDRLELRHYSLGKGRQPSWMDLKLRGGGVTLHLDDRLTGFEAIVHRAWLAAKSREIGLSDSTLVNLTALGKQKKTTV